MVIFATILVIVSMLGIFCDYVIIVFLLSSWSHSTIKRPFYCIVFIYQKYKPISLKFYFICLVFSSKTIHKLGYKCHVD
jgi:hypothetical protein